MLALLLFIFCVAAVIFCVLFVLCILYLICDLIDSKEDTYD